MRHVQLGTGEEYKVWMGIQFGILSISSRGSVECSSDIGQLCLWESFIEMTCALHLPLHSSNLACINRYGD